ncbi:Lrp/AsnC family transcriptional regulator [Roseivirga sp. E12]|uniref:Lrp/AsnC family transcriptional regulator n=1 Tax=Roseivirga sp. E12 TaxID=2819237 RepID=UPI001ABCC094|nr:Lrp/AsnC family transcriptional regulator [Roseivirga sp. E12]MBO3699158.1 Lrp/AsnC family transcriptional regulator [Roseivirga sp. E12]
MIDNVDLQILTLLQQDGKITTKEISGKLGLTITPVHERIKRLERTGYIDHYTAIVNRTKVGLDLLVFCSVSLKNHQRAVIEKFENDIKKLPAVVECYHIGGMFDYLLKVVSRDMKEYQSFISTQLAGLDNIGNVQSSFVMSEIKYSSQLPTTNWV